MTQTLPVGEGPGDGSRAVAIGGGHGLSRSLAALTHVVDHVTAVVTVADDGGSSGRLRRDLDVIPPGDLRMALAALSPEHDLVELVQYRFAAGELEGHSLGNLILVALRDLAGGDMVRGLDRLAALLAVRGRVLPCTRTPLTLHAETSDGRVDGQVDIARTPRPERVFVEPRDAPGLPDAVEAVERADLVVLGPGSLYTSLIPNLLIRDVGAAVAKAHAPVVLVGNLREQPGETEGMSLADHLTALADHVPDVGVDVLVCHDGRAPSGPGEPLRCDDELPVPRLVAADLLDGEDGHDPTKLAAVLRDVLRR